jgi:hypothetical protein
VEWQPYHHPEAVREVHHAQLGHQVLRLQVEVRAEAKVRGEDAPVRSGTSCEFEKAKTLETSFSLHRLKG